MPSRTLLLLAPISFAIPLLAALSLAPPIAQQAAPQAAPKKVARNAAEQLLDRMETSRYGTAKDAGQGTMRLHGRMSVALPGRTAEKPLAGEIEIVFDGERMWERIDYGPQGISTQVLDEKLSWGIHPVFGSKIHRGIEELWMRRIYGIVRGAPWRSIYTSAEMVRDERQEGKTRTILRLFDGPEYDTWMIDPESLRVVRIETVMHDCSSKGDTKIPAKFEYDDWRPVRGISYPFLERWSMEGTTGEARYDSIERGIEVDPHLFDVPEKIRELQSKQAAEAGDAELPAPQIVQCEEQPVASIRVKIKADQVHRTLAQLLPQVMACLTEIGASASGPPFARFHGEGEGDVDFEAGVPVAAPIAAHDPVKPSTLPGGRILMTWHSGAYSELADERTRLAKAAAEMHLKPRGGAWIYYWTDPTVEREKSRRRSQIIQPIE